MKTQNRNGRAFSLVEVVIALGVVAFCLLSVLALLPLGLTTSRDSLQRTTAASIASEISSDFRLPTVTSGGNTVTPRFQINTAAGTYVLYFDGSDNFSTTASASTLYRATVTVGTTSYGTIPLRIFVTWPGLADATPANTPANYTGSLDVSTAVNTLSP